MAHVALLGDSILDNSAYTRGEPDVLTHLRTLLPPSWRATLCAVDGATTGTLGSQLPRVPRDATHLVLAIGGNDALGNIDLLTAPVRSSGQALLLFAERLAAFEGAYCSALDRVIALGRAVTVCTIYNGALEPEAATPARVGLMMFNDVILRTAFVRHVDVIELRTICTEPADYANPIEPSGQGGLKIAKAIARALGGFEADAPLSRVFAG